MRLQDYLLLIGAFLVVPLWYDLSKGRPALKEALKNKTKAIEILLLSLILVDVIWFLLKIYLMIKQLPLSTKY